MEDQQPAADDLTDEAGADVAAADTVVDGPPAQADETEVIATQSDSDETDEDEDGSATEDEEAADGPAADDADPAGSAKKAKSATKPKRVRKPKRARKPRKKYGRRAAAVVVAVIATLFVGSAAFAGAMLQPYLSEQATVEIKQNVARAAVNAVTTLWSYTPENIDGLSARAGKYLTGDFGAQYRKFIETVVGPTKQMQITNSTEVTGVAVESLEGPNAVVIVFTNTTNTTPQKKNIPGMQYLSFRVSMKREHGDWLVTRMNTVTSLDMTPKL